MSDSANKSLVSDAIAPVERLSFPPAPKGGAGGERKVKFNTARDLVAQTPSELQWIVRPWIAEGTIIEVLGLPKLAGKTTWVLQLIRAALNGGTFLGVRASKTPVIYLCEGPPFAFHQALREAALDDNVDLRIAYKHECAGLKWIEVVSEAACECVDVGAKLLVIDTISSFISFRSDGENSASAVLEALAPLKLLAADGVGILLVRHARKGGGDIISSGRGSDAFEGEVDHVIRLQRVDDLRDNVRFIDAVGRLRDTPSEMYVELRDDTYHVVTEDGARTPKVVELARQAVLAIAPTSGASAKRVRALAADANMSDKAIRAAVKDLVEEGLLVANVLPGKGSPQAYWRPPTSTPVEATPSAPLHGVCRLLDVDDDGDESAE